MINVVLLVYKRIETFKNQLNCLCNQTCVKDIHLHIICNNNELESDFEKIVNEYKNKIKITFVKKQNKLMFLERHCYVYDNKFDYVIFLDDDFYLKEEYIKNLFDMRRKKTFFTFFGRVFENRNNIKLMYSKNKPNILPSMMKLKKDVNIFNYGGPGFSVLDCSIYDDFFKLYKSLNKEMQDYAMKMDDIFLSWVINNTEKWSIKNTFLIPDNCENMYNHSSFQALWKYKDIFTYKLNEIQTWKVIKN